MVDEVKEKQKDQAKSSDIIPFPKPVEPEKKPKVPYQAFTIHNVDRSREYFNLVLESENMVAGRYIFSSGFAIDGDHTVIKCHNVFGKTISIHGKNLYPLWEALEQHVVNKMIEFAPARFIEPSENEPIIHRFKFLDGDLTTT